MIDDARAQFDTLLGDYYESWFRFHPETAVDLGVSGFEGLLRPYDDDDVGALLVLQEKVLNSLEDIDAGALDPDRQIDLALVAGQANIEHHELLEYDWRRRDPQQFIPVYAIYQLTVKPVGGLRAAMEQRLKQFPSYLRGARRHLADMPELIPPNWLGVAVTTAETGAEFLRKLDRHPRVQRAFAGNGHLHELLEAAARALREYGRFLEDELGPRASGEFAAGRENFERLLTHRHFLPVDADQYHTLGVQLFDQTLDDLRDVTRSLRGDENIQALGDAVHASHPRLDSLLQTCRTQIQAARAFVLEHDLVSVPAAEKLHVVEAPGFLRNQIPFADYLSPVPDDPEQNGYCYVTPAAESSPPDEFCSPCLMHACVHATWPGHHLRCITANHVTAARTLPRRVNTSATLCEGWALYSEQLMQEQGFLSLPEQKFILLRDRLWRALSVMLDVELHTRDVDLDQAAGRMQQIPGFSRQQAMADLARYSRSPTTPTGYTAGWALINVLRDQVVGAGASLKVFHDRLLSAGSIALPLVIRHVFGDDHWQQAERKIFLNLNGNP